ncbi:hypothetical protein PPN31114_03676 [Pandoraea pneumonica]|jgi:hypothetical protein|uniref:Uncharacterized protein n=1 Tax=Pandoraea pneumonica TaxID=2508299 RepID=A0A5E4X4S3_9BURK|nr:hypothetical protein [Pandoraea pneumonica]VVE31314.1 hypothetical protein PPN31114_03676 [Pandoraea pneumonica]
MKKVSLTLLALFASIGVAHAQVPSASGTGILSNTTSVSGSAASVAPGQSYTGASATQMSSFTLQPGTTTNTYASTQMNLVGTTQTSGSALAFNASVGGGSGGAIAQGTTSSTANGTLAFPSAHGTGTGSATSGTSNYAQAGSNEANSNASASGANFYSSIQQDVAYTGPQYNGFSVTNTTSAGGSASVDNIAATGLAALTSANINLANIPNVNQIGAGATYNESSGFTNTLHNTASSNASFGVTVKADNTSPLSVVQLPTPTH